MLPCKDGKTISHTTSFRVDSTRFLDITKAKQMLVNMSDSIMLLDVRRFDDTWCYHTDSDAWVIMDVNHNIILSLWHRKVWVKDKALSSVGLSVCVPAAYLHLSVLGSTSCPHSHIWLPWLPDTHSLDEQFELDLSGDCEDAVKLTYGRKIQICGLLTGFCRVIYQIICAITNIQKYNEAKTTICDNNNVASLTVCVCALCSCVFGLIRRPLNIPVMSPFCDCKDQNDGHV